MSDTPITDAGCAMVYLVSGSSFEAADPAVSRKLERDLTGALRESEDRNQQWAAKSIYASHLERDLAEARIEIGKANVCTAHWQACCSEDTIAQLAAHKAALEKTEQALGRMVPCQFRDQALAEIAKLRGGAA